MPDLLALEERVAQLEQGQRDLLAANQAVQERANAGRWSQILLLLSGLLLGLVAWIWFASERRAKEGVIEAAETLVARRLDDFGRDTLPALVSALVGDGHIASMRRDAEEAATRALQNADATQVLVSRLHEKLREAQSQLDALRARLATFDEKVELRVGKLIAREILVDNKLEAGEVALKNGRARLYVQTHVGGDGSREEVAQLQLFGPQTDQPDTNPVASLSASRLATGEQRAVLDLRTHERVGQRARVALHAFHGSPQGRASIARGEFEDQDHVLQFSADAPEILKFKR